MGIKRQHYLIPMTLRNVKYLQLWQGVTRDVHNLLACYKLSLATYQGLGVVRGRENIFDLNQEEILHHPCHLVRGYTKYNIQCHMVFYVIMVTFWKTLLYERVSKIMSWLMTSTMVSKALPYLVNNL